MALFKMESSYSESLLGTQSKVHGISVGQGGRRIGLIVFIEAIYMGIFIIKI